MQIKANILRQIVTMIRRGEYFNLEGKRLLRIFGTNQSQTTNKAFIWGFVINRFICGLLLDDIANLYESCIRQYFGSRFSPINGGKTDQNQHHSVDDKYTDAQESANSNVGDHHNIPKTLLQCAGNSPKQISVYMEIWELIMQPIVEFFCLSKMFKFHDTAW